CRRTKRDSVFDCAPKTRLFTVFRRCCATHSRAGTLLQEHVRTIGCRSRPAGEQNATAFLIVPSKPGCSRFSGVAAQRTRVQARSYKSTLEQLVVGAGLPANKTRQRFLLCPQNPVVHGFPALLRNALACRHAPTKAR